MNPRAVLAAISGPKRPRLVSWRVNDYSDASFEVFDNLRNDTGLNAASGAFAYWPDASWAFAPGVPTVRLSSAPVGSSMTFRAIVAGGTPPYTMTTGSTDGGGSLAITVVSSTTIDLKVTFASNVASVGFSVSDVQIKDARGLVIDLGPLSFGQSGTLLIGSMVPMSSSPGKFWPIPLNIYLPAGVTITRFFTCLHGGSGDQNRFAQNLRISFSATQTAGNVNWPMLAVRQCAVVIPNSTFCTLGALPGIPSNAGPFNPGNSVFPNGVETVSATNPNGVRSWEDGFMHCGSDSPSFLHDCSAWLTSTFSPTIGTFGKVLCGHSNGGFMAQQMLWQHPNDWSHFCGTSNPLSLEIPITPVPKTKRSMFMQIGGIDDILNVSGGPAGPGDHFYDETLQQGPSTLSVADWLYPDFGYFYGPFAYYQALCSAFGETPGDPVTKSVAIGLQSTWVSSGGTFVLQLLTAAGHTIVEHEQCSRRRTFDDWFNAARGQPPT